MIVFLFGAGASFGSGNVHPINPPLGNSLFNSLQRLFPGTWGQIPDELSSKFENDFEKGMHEVIDNHSFSIAPLMQHMGIFFSRFNLYNDKPNYYKSLVSHIKNESLLDQTVFSSLNYECLLEIAFSQKGIQINYFDEPSDNSASIFKLHGSCNFKSNNIQASRGVQFSSGVSFEGGIQIIQPREVPRVFKGNTGLYPAMCLYAKNKPLAIAPSQIKEAQKKWKDITEKADKVFIIGVKPNVEDKHIWEPLANSEAHLYYVGLEEDFSNWTTEHRSNNHTYLGSTWEKTHDEILRELN